jgi:predicted DNA-binding transcriptional regulator YafY
MTVEVGGLQQVMSWVIRFGRHAEVLEPAHLRQAVVQELAATPGKYAEQPAPVYEEDSQQGTS